MTGLGRLKTYSNRKGAGADGLLVKLLKYAGASSICVLTHLFNAVYNTG